MDIMKKGTDLYADNSVAYVSIPLPIAAETAIQIGNRRKARINVIAPVASRVKNGDELVLKRHRIAAINPAIISKYTPPQVKPSIC